MVPPGVTLVVSHSVVQPGPFQWSYHGPTMRDAGGVPFCGPTRTIPVVYHGPTRSDVGGVPFCGHTRTTPVVYDGPTRRDVGGVPFCGPSRTTPVVYHGPTRRDVGGVPFCGPARTTPVVLPWSHQECCWWCPILWSNQDHFSGPTMVPPGVTLVSHSVVPPGPFQWSYQDPGVFLVSSLQCF